MIFTPSDYILWSRFYAAGIIAWADITSWYLEGGTEERGHDSDCALHSEPAFPAGTCNCSLSREQDDDA